jgi:hypothetical protein
MNIEDLRDQINALVQEQLKETKTVSAEQLGLDPRAGYRLYVPTDEAETFIAVKKDNRHALDYYGGFEYIDKEYIFELGDYVFYTEHSCVIDAFDYMCDIEA